MTDFGTDVAAFPAISPTFALVTGNALIAQAIARRLVTPRGTLFWDPQYGTDVTALLSSRVDDTKIFQIEAMVQAEALKDERVLACDLTTTWNAALGSLSIRLSLTTADGPFTTVMEASALTVSVLSVT